MTDSIIKIDFEEDKIGREIVDAAIFIHKELGPGLLESVYEACLFQELCDRGFNVQRQKPIDIFFKGKPVKEGFRADLIVEAKVLIEIKTVDKIIPVHQAQVLSYLKMTGLRLGYLINFNEALLKNGLKRFVKRNS